MPTLSTNPSRRIVLLATSLLIATTTMLPFAAQAQAWPGKPVHVIVNFPPGGAADLLAATLFLDMLAPHDAGRSPDPWNI